MEWLNYHHLYYFWCVMREGSITAACRKLHLVPATVSAQIGKLEQALDGKLFTRVGRNLEPTELGQHVFRYADEIFSIGRELMDSLNNFPGPGRNPLRIGVVDAIPKLVVRRLLEPVLQMTPPVRLICPEGKKNDLIAELSLHRLDAVLSDAPMGPELSVKAYSHVLGECGVSFFAAPDLAGKLGAEFPNLLDGAPFLMPMETTSLRAQLDTWFHSLNIRPVIVGEFNDSALLKAFGQQGDGVFTAPSVIEGQVMRQYRVRLVGRAGNIREKFYIISIERILHHPAVSVVSQTANRFFRELRENCLYESR